MLRLSKAEEKNGGRTKTSILGDACEAVMAALYLDGGMEAAAHFFKTFWGDELNDKGQYKDPKSALQEWAQSQGLGLPEYKETDRSGPDHSPVFTICVTVGPHTATANAGSKQSAERDAAIALLAKVTP